MEKAQTVPLSRFLEENWTLIVARRTDSGHIQVAGDGLGGIFSAFCKNARAGTKLATERNSMAQKFSRTDSSAEWSESHPEQKDRRAPNILLIEDQMEDVVLIERAFRLVLPGAGLEVLHNGEEAIAYLLGDGRYADRKNYPMPDLILLDLKLPRVSGL